MIEIMGLIVLLVVSVVVFSGWLFSKTYCQTATEYLSEHPRLNFVVHVFTGLGSGWLIALWMPRKLALVLGAIVVVVAVIMRYAISMTKAPGHARSIGMHVGLPVGVAISWLSYPWMPKIPTLVLGAVLLVVGETAHYLFPNLVSGKWK